MPFLNSLGEWAGGTTGDVAWGDDTATGTVVWTPASWACWVDDNTLAGQYCPDSCSVYTKNVRTDVEVEVAARGASVLSAGGGHWAGWLGSYGVYTSWGLLLPDAGIFTTSVGPDGACAVQTNIGEDGWVVHEPDSTTWTLTTGNLTQVQLLGGQRAIWTEDDEPHATGAGVPTPEPLTSPYYWLRMLETANHGWWILYQLDSAELVLQDEDGMGYVVTTGEVYQPDLVLLGDDTIRVAYSTTAVEAVADVVVIEFDVVNDPRTDLSELLPPETVDPDPPDGTITITNTGFFSVADRADEAPVVPEDIFPAYPHESGFGRLRHPTLGLYEYEVKPDEWVNIDADAIVPPTWSSTMTLTSAANVLWPGNLRDVIVEERWKALGGLAMPMTQLRALMEMWTTTVDPEVDYVRWYPTYITRVAFKVLIVSVSAGGQGIKFDDVVNYKDENDNDIGWMTAPVTVVMRLVERL